MIARVAVLCLLATASFLARPVSAQSGDRTFALGIAAYRSLEYDSAVTRFQRALDAAGSDSLRSNRRTDVLAYLGAAELLRANTTAANVAFVKAIAMDPRYRIDEFVFPPPVTSAFEAARLTTAYFIVGAPSSSLVRVHSDSLPIRISASAPNDVTISLMRQNGTIVRQIYAGALKDSAVVFWNGTDSAGNAAVAGTLVLQVKSARTVPNGGDASLPLTVERLPVDTLPHPAPPATMPRTSRSTYSGSSIRALLAGTLIGSAAIFLPEFVGDNRNAMPERYVVGGTLGAAGIFGFLSGRRRGQQALADSVAADKARVAWLAAVENVKAENARRLRSPQIRILAAPQTPRRGGDE